MSFGERMRARREELGLSRTLLARRLGVETPVTDTVQGLLHGGESPREAVMRLMTRTLRQE